MQILRNFRNYFFRGMAALLPTILSIWIFIQFYKFIRDNLSLHINKAIVNLILLITDDYSREFLESFWVHGRGQIVGFVIPFILVCVLGAILASVVGRTLGKAFDRALMKVPLVKRVYPYIRQITDFVFTDEKMAFKKVVAVQYPRKGIWSLALVTGSGMQVLSDAAEFENDDFLTVFIPSSPTPFTGYVIIVNKEDTIELDITIEEALRFTVSGGVITPTDWRAMQAKDEI